MERTTAITPIWPRAPANLKPNHEPPEITVPNFVPTTSQVRARSTTSQASSPTTGTSEVVEDHPVNLKPNHEHPYTEPSASASDAKLNKGHCVRSLSHDTRDPDEKVLGLGPAGP